MMKNERNMGDPNTIRIEDIPREIPLEVQKTYFSTMSHELNNFLQCIQGSITMAKDKIAGNKEMEDLLDDCATASHNSICLLRSYSVFINKSADYFKSSEIDIIDIARRSAKMLLRDARINFLFGSDNVTEYILGDEIQIYQLFHNLLKNAKESMTDNRITIRMDISRTIVGMENPDGLEPGEYIMIIISDNGAGIVKHNIENIFNPYFTLKKTGTGLGLSICLGIVKRHKGSIRVDSEPGKGTVFTILLPAVQID